jgi:hypothetical protein
VLRFLGGRALRLRPPARVLGLLGALLELGGRGLQLLGLQFELGGLLLELLVGEFEFQGLLLELLVGRAQVARGPLHRVARASQRVGERAGEPRDPDEHGHRHVVSRIRGPKAADRGDEVVVHAEDAQNPGEEPGPGAAVPGRNGHGRVGDDEHRARDRGRERHRQRDGERRREHGHRRAGHGARTVLGRREGEPVEPGAAPRRHYRMAARPEAGARRASSGQWPDIGTCSAASRRVHRSWCGSSDARVARNQATVPSGGHHRAPKIRDPSMSPGVTAEAQPLRRLRWYRRRRT